MAKKEVKLVEIRLHGRGGQGAKSAAEIFAAAALDEKCYIQAFPDYGPERQGAPMKAYVRISDKPITIHSDITKPGYVVVIDPALLETINVTEGLKDNGMLIANTTHSKKELKKALNFNGKIYTVDATKISLDCFGKNIPNTPMLGAVAKTIGLVNIKTLEEKLKQKFIHKLGEEGVNKNIKALEQGYDKVK